MANAEQLEVLKQGVEVWNEWRQSHPEASIDLNNANLTDLNLQGINFSKANLSNAILYKSNLSNAILRNANLSGADLHENDLSSADIQGAIYIQTNLSGINLTESDLKDANLSESNLSSARLSGADFFRANLYKADLTNANLVEADLSEANLYRAKLNGANLTGASMRKAILVEAELDDALLTNSQVYGLSAWGIKGVLKEQLNLIITPVDEPTITVDDLEVAQFVYLLVNNEKIRKVIDTVTSKAVLILGRFTKERKLVLDAVRNKLKEMNLTPIIFDFEKPTNQDLTGTVETLARMAKFIIADLTDPNSVPHELASIVPFLRTTPVLPIKLNNASGYPMFKDLKAYPWVLPTHEYKDGPSLIAELSDVIKPANEMAEAFRKME